MVNLSEKQLHAWMPGYARHWGRRALVRRPDGTRHLLFALCDHFEPFWGGPDEDIGKRRVARWLDEYPKAFDKIRDADGRMPQHSWFFPGEEYRPVYLDSLAKLAQRGCGEVEVHLHHDKDTEEGLRSKIQEYLRLYDGHGHLARDAAGVLKYAFIHGNWALANGRRDRRMCGVDAELSILFDSGCYADFTFPSVPSCTQSNMVNCIYWPTGNLKRRRAYGAGEFARVGKSYDDRILIITGPLSFALRPHTCRPRLEYGDLRPSNPPTASRVKSWVDQDIHVAGRSAWTFVKVYIHGAVESAADLLFGAGGQSLHRALVDNYSDGVQWRLHYVTAREMFNIARAAMDGKDGDPGQYRDYILAPPPVIAQSSRG